MERLLNQIEDNQLPVEGWPYEGWPPNTRHRIYVTLEMDKLDRTGYPPRDVLIDHINVHRPTIENVSRLDDILDGLQIRRGALITFVIDPRDRSDHLEVIRAVTRIATRHIREPIIGLIDLSEIDLRGLGTSRVKISRSARVNLDGLDELIVDNSSEIDVDGGVRCLTDMTSETPLGGKNLSMVRVLKTNVGRWRRWYNMFPRLVSLTLSAVPIRDDTPVVIPKNVRALRITIGGDTMIRITAPHLEMITISTSLKGEGQVTFTKGTAPRFIQSENLHGGSTLVTFDGGMPARYRVWKTNVRGPYIATKGYPARFWGFNFAERLPQITRR